MKFRARISAPAAALCAVLATALPAHEFWISADSYQVAAGGTIDARFRNGENFEGSELAFFDRSSDRLQVVLGGDGAAARDLTPRNGDRPAIVLPDMPDGLAVLIHETAPSRLTYRSWEKFEKFAKHKDFPGIADAHDARGLPREDFRESYTRHAKALIGVGTAPGADRATGMKTEFVALTNPYAPNFAQNMKAELLYKSRPRPDAQVEVFDRAPDGTVTVRLARTDAAGIVSIQTKPGHTYLLDAVVLRVPETDADEVAWETLWAALTFAVPD